MIFKERNIVCVTSTRPQNMSLSYGATARSLANRRRFLSGLGIDYRSLVCAKQTHSDNVSYVTQAESGRGAFSYENALPDTDALITDKKNIPLAVFTADCLPIFLYDPKNKAIGLIHAGWRGSLKGITAKTIVRMRERFKSRPEYIYAGLGPCIRSCCYKVGAEFSGLFPDDLFLRKRAYYLDLISLNKKQLLGQGLKEGNILDSRICTCCKNKKYFSFRKEGDSAGRMISLLMLK